MSCGIYRCPCSRSHCRWPRPSSDCSRRRWRKPCTSRSCSPPSRGACRSSRSPAPRVAIVDAADLRSLRPGHRRAALGIVHRRIRHGVAGPWTVDVRGAARARRLPGGGCAATGAAFLALGTMTGDLLLAAADPRVQAGAGAMKRAAWSLLFLIAVAALGAPWLAPNPPESAVRRSALRAADARSCARGRHARAIHLSLARGQPTRTPIRG